MCPLMWRSTRTGNAKRSGKTSSGCDLGIGQQTDQEEQCGPAETTSDYNYLPVKTGKAICCQGKERGRRLQDKAAVWKLR